VGLIYLDTCLLIYALEDVPALGAQVKDAMAQHPQAQFAVSALVMLECLVAPLRDTNLVLQRYYEEAFAQMEVLPLTEAVFLQAAHLRARFALKTPDALHLACAQHHRCTALWTNDERLASAAHGLAINITAA
jgi:uncharacterized protein